MREGGGLIVNDTFRAADGAIDLLFGSSGSDQIRVEHPSTLLALLMQLLRASRKQGQKRRVRMRKAKTSGASLRIVSR